VDNSDSEQRLEKLERVAKRLAYVVGLACGIVAYNGIGSSQMAKGWGISEGVAELITIALSIAVAGIVAGYIDRD
jgi:hypothetical protein